MSPTDLTQERMNELRQRLLGGAPFLELANSFIDRAVRDDAEPQFKEYFVAAMRATRKRILSKCRRWRVHQ
jgi:hypothetical protein